jgi:LEA14-like dessication related protein
MKKKTKIMIILIIITILILTIFSSLVIIFRFRKPETTVISLEIKEVDEDEKKIYLGLGIQIFNPNRLEMKIIEIDGDILIDGEMIGPIFNRTGSRVPAGGTSTIDLVIIVDDIGLTVLSGDTLTIEGRAHGEYLWMEGSSDFQETMDIPGLGDDLENLPPIGVIEAPLTAVVLEDVQFDGSNSWDPDGSIVEYNWDMGDGTQLEGDTVNHRYSSAGTYLVRLTVVDDLGDHDDATHRITVRLRF